MPSKAQFRFLLMFFVAAEAAMALPRIWAARHAAEGERGKPLTVVADAIQAAV